MAGQIDTTRTWAPGDSVTAAAMNEIIDQAFAEPAIIDGKTSVNAAAGDYILLTRAGVLKKADVSTVPQGVTSMKFHPPTLFNFTGGGGTPDYEITTAGTWNMSWVQQGPGKVLAGPVSGGVAAPTFRILTPADMAITPVTIAAYAIDLSLGNVFKKTFPDNLAHTLTFTADTGTPGQTIKIRLQRFNSGGGVGVITWTAAGTGGDIRWPGGTVPVMTTGNSKVDVFEFLCVGNNSYEGIRWGADLS